MLKGSLFVVLVVGVLCSCAGDSTTGSGSREETAGGSPSAGVGTSAETTFSGAPRAEEQTRGPDPQKNDAGQEPREEPASSSTPLRPAVGTNGLVSSAHPLATRAGIEVLEDGGNAFDAAVAVAASLGVVEPYMSGIGGYGAMVLYDADSGRTRYLGASTRVPEALDPDVFRPTAPAYQANRQSAPAISTPGAVNDWEALWEEHGELGWPRLLEPAIRQAEEGFVLDTENAGWISSEFYAFPSHAQEVYGEGGVPLVAGQRLVQADLGRSLCLISEDGASAVYGGTLGEAMVSEAQQNGGFMTASDLEANRPEWRETISISYRDHKVVTSSPPTTAWNSLTRLGVMSRFDPAELGHNSAAYLGTYAAVTEQAFYERSEYAADPDLEPTPLDQLLSEDHWEQEAANLEAPATAPATSSASPPSSSAPQASLERGQGHTTHFVVADSEGNVVSATQTLGNIFGSKVMPEGTGIWLNNAISYSTFEPEGNPLDVFPGRYRLSGIAPTIIMRDGRPRIAIGAHGGFYILQTTPQMVMNLIDFDLDIQQAIAAPRLSFVEPNSLAVDSGMPLSVWQELAALGYDVYVDEYGLGNAHGLTVEYGAGGTGEPIRFTGGADPRAQGVATGY